MVSVDSEKSVDVRSVIVLGDDERFVDDVTVDVTSGVVEGEEVSVDDGEELVNVVSVFVPVKSVLSVTELDDDENSVDVVKDDVKLEVGVEEELSDEVNDEESVVSVVISEKLVEDESVTVLDQGEGSVDADVVDVASVAVDSEEVSVDFSVVVFNDDEDSVTVVMSVVGTETLVDNVSAKKWNRRKILNIYGDKLVFTLSR